MLVVSDIVPLKIESLSFGGDGIGRHNDFVLFVPFCSPGDELLVEITEIKKKFGRAIINEILKPGPARTHPVCPVFSECGGCQWQHIQYEEQLNQKQKILEKAFKKLNLIDKIKPIQPSTKSYNYRNRIQLHIKNDKFGYLKKSSHQLIPIDNCPIAEEKINSWLQQNSSRLISFQKKVELFIDNDIVKLQDLHSQGGFRDFNQVNTEQNEYLKSYILEKIQKLNLKKLNLLDLYCGSGNLSLFLTKYIQDITIHGCDINKRAIDKAHKFIRENSIKNCFYTAQDADTWLQKNPIQPDVLLIDPPRAGLTQHGIELINKVSPQYIIFVSCDPMTHSRDLERLTIQNNNFSVLEIKPLDMFPQTSHIETITFLERNSPPST